MVNFSDILNTKLGDIKVLPPLPEGLYRGRLSPTIKYEEVGEKRTPCAVFEVLLLEPLEVDDTELVAAGGMRENAKTRMNVWLSEASLPRAKDFIAACGVKGKDKNLGEALEACGGAEVRVLVRHEPDRNNPEVRYLRAEKVLPL